MSFLKKIYLKLFPKAPVDYYTSVLKDWQNNGSPLPPPHIVKQLIIKNLNAKFQYHLFIETGTYLGEMVEAQKKNFDRIITIELSENLFKDAVNRFKNDAHITILNGDSGDVLADINSQINEPAIFWLDGHYSAGITAKGKKSCPIYEELTAIFKGPAFPHILLIDDARLFVGADDYPTILELTDFIKASRPGANIYVESDIIHVFI